MLKVDTAIAPRRYVRWVSIVCLRCGWTFSWDMYVDSIWHARGILSRSHHRGCGGAFELRQRHRDRSRRFESVQQELGF